VTRLFGEDASRVVIACAPEEASRIEQLFSGGSPGIWRLGMVTDGDFRIRMQTYTEESPNKFKRAEIATLVDTKIADLRDGWSNALQSTLSVDTVTA
jgi:hypothetical protein